MLKARKITSKDLVEYWRSFLNDLSDEEFMALRNASTERMAQWVINNPEKTLAQKAWKDTASLTQAIKNLRTIHTGINLQEALKICVTNSPKLWFALHRKDPKCKRIREGGQEWLPEPDVLTFEKTANQNPNNALNKRSGLDPKDCILFEWELAYYQNHLYTTRWKPTGKEIVL